MFKLTALNKKTLALFSALLVLSTIAFTQTKTWFFLRTGNAPVNLQEATKEYDPKGLTAVYEGEEFAVPEYSDNENVAGAAVLGDHSDKRIEVNLTAQRIYAIEDGEVVYDYPVSTGKPWWPTPTGTFYTWIKLRYTRMEGGSKALGTYYNLPNVPYVMYFHNDEVPKWKGYALHGAYWHNDFGNTRSHGCVNVHPDNMANIYHWAEPAGDIPIKIYGETPTN